ncbi:hypothetical protein GTL21_002375 [Salmonella enterica]|nr:hypothetical protein [Salmonella enterica]
MKKFNEQERYYARLNRREEAIEDRDAWREHMRTFEKKFEEENTIPVEESGKNQSITLNYSEIKKMVGDAYWSGLKKGRELSDL